MDAVDVDSSGDEDIQVDVQLWPVDPNASSTMAELYSRPRVVPIYKQLVPGSIGISCDVDTGWDALDWADRGRFLRWQDEALPKVVITSAPCTVFSQLQHVNKKRRRADVFEKIAVDGKLMLDFSMLVCEKQVDGGRGFIHEHPRYASSWAHPSVVNVMGKPTVRTIDFDQCTVGLKSPSGKLLKKPTRLMTNMASCVFEFQNMTCRCTELHAGQIQGRENGVQVSAHAAVYPPLMVERLARACM